MRGESQNGDLTRTEIRHQAGEKSARVVRRRLVLDGDVKTWHASIPRDEKTVQGVGHTSANFEKRRTFDPERDAAAQRIRPAYPSDWRRRISHDPPYQPLELATARRRKLMKKRDMRGHGMAKPGIILSPKPIEKSLIGRAHRRSDDDRRGPSHPGGRG